MTSINVKQELRDVSAADLVAVYDVTAGADRKCTIADVLGRSLRDLSAKSAAVAGDLVTIFDSESNEAAACDVSVLLGEPEANIEAPSGGGTIDAEARTAIGAILDLLLAKNLMAEAEPPP